LNSIYLFKIHQSGEHGNYASKKAFENPHHEWDHETQSLEQMSFLSQRQHHYQKSVLSWQSRNGQLAGS
jgi:hypothetical protein